MTLGCLTLALFSCSYMMGKIDRAQGPQVQHLDVPSDKTVHLIFGGSINGETHPCGCRHFPLGGLPAVAGVLEQTKNKYGPFIYLDTGDLLFPSNNVPHGVDKSLTFMAQNLFKGMQQLGLRYMVIGDYDLSKGPVFFNDLIKNSGIQVLVANIAPQAPLITKPWARVDAGPTRIYIIGLVNPDVFIPEHQSYFTDPAQALEQALKEVREDGFKASNPQHRIILLSHSGMDFDIALVADRPEIAWVFGGHSQSFIRIPTQSGSTQLVQVLSKNHYLGHLILDPINGPTSDAYDLIEVRQELEAGLTPNPMTSFIAEHKKRVAELQAQEQSAMVTDNNDMPKFPPAQYCIDCHKPQGKHWGQTAHSVAFLTLIRAKEQNNLACIKCHSLGLENSRGFERAADVVELTVSHQGLDADESAPVQDVKTNKMKTLYWKKISKLADLDTKGNSDLRSRLPSERLKITKAWVTLDQKLSTISNFANVQCLNCHNQASDHPFSIKQPGDIPTDLIARRDKIKNACLECHTPEQSPEWYQATAKGLAGALDENKFGTLYKKIRCPAYIEE